MLSRHPIAGRRSHRTMRLLWAVLWSVGFCILTSCESPPVATSDEKPVQQAYYDSLVVDSLFTLARAQFDSADYAASLQVLRKAELNLALDSNASVGIRGQKLSYLKGNVQAQMGLIPAALQTFRESLALADGKGFGDSLQRVFKGRACNALANRFSQLGMLDSAAYYSQRALGYLQGFSRPDPMNLSIGLTTLGIILQGQAENAADRTQYLERADSCFQAVLRIRQTLPGLAPRKLGNAYLNLGDLHRVWGHAETAEDAFQEAQRYYAQAGPNAEDAMAVTVAAVAQNAEQQAKPDLAASKYAQALEYCDRAYQQPHRETGKILVLQGNFWVAQKEGDKALRCFHQALHEFVPEFTDSARHHNPPLWMIGHEWYVTSALVGKARAYALLPGLQDSAFQCYAAAFQFADRLRRNFGTVDEKAGLAEFIYPAYEEAIAAAISEFQQTHDHDDLELAFEFIERSKANELLDALDQVAITQEYALPDSIWLRGRAINTSLDSSRQRLTQGDLQAADRLIALQDDSISLQAWVKAHYPGYFFPDNAYLPWDEVRKQCVGKDTMVVEYFLGAEQLFVLAACGERDTAFAVDWDASLQAALVELQAALDLRHQPPLNPCFTDPAWLLFRAIVQPALAICGPASPLPRRMIVVPDGHLAFIPFEALLTAPAGGEKNAKRLPYLLRSTAVTYVQSLQFLLRTRSLASQASFPGVLGVGSDLKFDNLQGSLRPLTNATGEVRHAVSLLGGEAIVNERATEGIFKERAPQYGLIHVATHGRMDARVPLRSSLFFHADPGTHDDGELHAYEIYGMDLRAELAVLSACSVGGGKSIKGQGVMSLGRSFMVAGCTNVVMTLQDVSDQKASEIMRRFYASLVDGHTAAEALQLARVQYISETDAEYAHPAYWSPFILVGPGEIDFVTQATPRKIWPYGLGACAVVAGIVLGWWLYMRHRRQSTM